MELWHGPTWAFKDVALQFLGNVFAYFLERRNQGKPEEEKEQLTVVGATSGDTGRYVDFRSLPSQSDN
jgi:threonine synthase